MRKKFLIYMIVFLMFISVFSMTPVRRNSLQAMTTPVVTLSDHSPDATNVQYQITFTTDLAHALDSSDYIEIRGFHIKYMPIPSFTGSNMVKVNGYDATNTCWTAPSSYSSDPDDYTIHIKVPNQITMPVTSITIIFSSSIGLKNPPLQTTWNETNHYDNNPAKNEWRLEIRTSNEGADIWSSPYVISPPAVSDVSVSVTPNTVDEIASYDIGFKTGPYGELHGGSSTITVQFPEGTVLPNSIPASSITVKVGSNQVHPSSVVTPSGEIVTITMPGSIYAGNNTEVHVIFNISAGIHNPSAASDIYLVEVKTSSENTFVESAYYSIMPSQVENLSVSVNPNVVSSVAAYSVTFKTSQTGALVKNSSYIFVTFPEGATVPPVISKSAISVNQTEASSCDVLANNIIKIQIPVDINSLSNVAVSISASAEIKNPSTPGNDYTISLYTTEDPGDAISNNYSIIESNITPASVTVSPDVVKVAASYVVRFSVGSNGMLSIGDKIYITFPTGAIVPNILPVSSVSVNGVICTQSPSVSGRKVSIYTPQFVPNNSPIIVVISASAGIKNPPVPKGNYKLLVSTSAESTPINSLPFEIKDTVKSSLDITPKNPDGKNGFYITKPKVKIVLTNPANITYSVYYKLDSESFRKYTTGFEIVIPEGIHTLSYYAQDSFGNKENTKQAQFKVDLTKPSLTITSPKSGDTFNSQSVTIEGQTSPGSILTIDGKSVNVESSGLFSYTYIFPKEGTFTLKIKSEDTAGNFSEANLTLKYTKQVRIMIQVGNKHCYINDKDYYLDAPSYIKNNRVMIPIRFVSEALGFTVQWDNIFRIVSIYVNGKTMRLQVGNTIADLFGKAVTLDAAPEIKNGRTFVPLRFISENFGAEVTWDGELRIVKIIYPGGE